MKDLILAIDQGTSGCKISLFDLDGQVVATRTKSYETTYPDEGFVEQDCNEWWQVSVEGIREMIDEDHIMPEDIKAIGVDGISWACIPIDIQGNVLRRTMIWLDTRAREEAEWMKATVGEETLMALSGNPIEPAYITPKMLWLKKHEPEIFAKTYKFLQSNGFLVYRLTGELSQDYSQGYGFHFFDVKKGSYNQEVAEQLGLSLDLVAPLKHCHEVIGRVTEAVAEITGLKAGTPVVAGGLDAACCTLGAGVMNVGQTQEQGGQAGGMSICLDSPNMHPKLILSYHVLPDKWLLQGGTTGGGGALKWFNQELGYKEQMIAQAEGSDPFTIMSKEAEDIPAGSEGMLYLPYMKGERSPLWHTGAKGVYYGLSFDKTRAHMIRSTMEGVAYALKHNLDTALEVGGKVNVMSSVGGSANSDVWTQLKSDITGKVIEVPYSDHATSLGAAILAGVGVGLYESFDEAVSRTVKVIKKYRPNEANREVYTAGYKAYRQLSQLLINEMFDL